MMNTDKNIFEEKVNKLMQENGYTRKKAEEEAKIYAARPGSSAHRTGRAIDFKLTDEYPLKPEYNDKLRDTKAYIWLEKNAEKFGFYNYEKEAWHWEYNPPAKK